MKGIGSIRMKKKTLGFLAAVLSMCMLAGCGAKDTGDGTDAATGAGAESTALKDMDVDKYVTLGEYKGLEVSVDTVEVDEDEWDSLVNNVYYENITAENGGIMDRAVETGDTVNIDYEGKKDDVAFDGGTAQGYDLTIGSGSFIAGFEDGLIGVMPGETVDLNLTFPENYGKSDLAGQAVVFTVTVNYIQPAQDGEFSDEVISNFGIDGVTNEEELRQYAYDYLNENAQQNYETNVQQAGWMRLWQITPLLPCRRLWYRNILMQRRAALPPWHLLTVWTEIRSRSIITDRIWHLSWLPILRRQQSRILPCRQWPTEKT